MKQLALIGIGQALLILGIVLFRKDRNLRDYFFGSFILLVISELLYRYGKFAGFITDISAYHYLAILNWSLIGPVFKLFIDHTFKIKSEFKLKDLTYFIPAAIVVMLLPYKLAVNAGIIYINDYSMLDIQRARIAYWIWDFISPIFIFLTIINIIKIKKEKIKKNLFIKYTSLGISVIIIVILLLRISSRFFLIKLFPDINFIDYLIPLVSLYVFGIGYLFYINEEPFWNKLSESVNRNVKTIIENSKYIRSGLQESEKELILESLQKLIEKDKIYLEYDLSIQDVADKIGTKVNKLSQAINETYDQNYFDFINSYRLEKAKELMENPEYLEEKIMAIAYDSGFGSKSTFYSVFKKYTNLTPTEYRKKLFENKYVLD